MSSACKGEINAILLQDCYYSQKESVEHFVYL